MGQQKTLIVKNAPWSDDAAELLELAIHDPIVGIESLRALVDSRRALLFEVLAAGELKAAYVIQSNQCDNGSELAVLAAGGALPGYSLTNAIMPHIEGQGAAFDRVRVSTSRPGMVRRLTRMGYKVMATTCVKVLHES